MNTAVTLLLPAAITFVTAMALQVFAKASAPRVAVLPLAAGLLIGWVVVAPLGWTTVDEVGRIAHIALGAGVLGLALDAVKPHRLVSAILVAIYVLGCALASVTGSVMLSVPVALREGVIIGVLAVGAFLVLARFDQMRERPLSLGVLLALLAVGVAVLAAIGQDRALLGPTLVLAAALAGYLAFVAISGAPAGDGIILLAGAPMLAIVWALAQRHPDMRLALACLPLVLFAEATAMRVPLPAARVSVVLYPLILAGLISLPLILAGLIAFVTSAP